MPSKIILKKSSIASKAPVAGDLDFGELAINYTDSKLYFKKADGSIDAFSSAAASAPVTSVGGNIGDITDSQLLASIKNVDGTGSGLDADTLDGLNSSAFYLASNPNGYTSNLGTVTSVGATSPVVSSGGTTPTISMPAATASVNGYMTAAYASKLDGIATGATNVTNTNQLTNGAGYITSSGSITGSAGSATYAANSSKLYSTDATYVYGGSNPYYGYLTYNSGANRWRFKVSPATPDGVEVAYADSAGSAGSVSGLTLTSSANGINPDSVTQNQLGYNNSVSLFGQADGGLYSSAYNGTWIHQIFGDFRTGQLAIRGKNSGTWQAWRTVLDSSNYTSYSPTLTGGGASGTWGISVTGSSNSVNLSGHTISNNSWAGGGGYHGYQYNGGNYRFGFSSTSGVVDVYADGNFYATDSSYLVHHDGNASRARNSDLMYYAGFTLDANTMPQNSTGFTYSVNAPYTGPVARFSTGGGYDLWLNSSYGNGNTLAFRTRQGDAGTLNAWRNLVSYGVNYGDSLYGTIMYDSNDTGWYIDPASTSITNDFRANIFYDRYDTSYYAQPRSISYFNDFRPNIIYDRNDTGYYIDANSNSNLYKVTGYQGAKYQSTDWADAFRNTPTSSRAFHGDVSSGGPQGTWWFYDSMRHSNASSYWGTQIAYGWEDNSNEIWQRNISGNSFSGWVRYLNSNNYSSYAVKINDWHGNLYHNTDGRIYSTIYYDANDSGYYIDANSTSRLVYLRPNRISIVGSQDNGEPRWDFKAYVVESQHHYGQNGSQTMFLGESNPVIVGGDIRSPIFYDSNNTGYYSNLDGTTYCYYLQSATTVRADSDRRLKDNIKPIQSALEKVRQLQGCTYTRKDLTDKTKIYMGMIAQDVLPIVPEVVSGSESGYYSLGYAELVPLLNEAIKEQDMIIQDQEARIKRLESLIEKLI